MTGPLTALDPPPGGQASARGVMIGRGRPPLRIRAHPAPLFMNRGTDALASPFKPLPCHFQAVAWVIHRWRIPRPVFADAHAGRRAIRPLVPRCCGTVTVHPRAPPRVARRPPGGGACVLRLLVRPGVAPKCRHVSKSPGRRGPYWDFEKWLTFPGPGPGTGIREKESGKIPGSVEWVKSPRGIIPNGRNRYHQYGISESAKE